MIYDVTVNGHAYALELKPGARKGEWLCRVGSAESGQVKPHVQELRLEAALSGEGVLSLLLDGKSYAFARDPDGTALVLQGKRFEIEVSDPRSLRSRRAAHGSDEGPRKLTAPMPGKVVRVLAAEGAEVEQGQGLIVVEAMKMQNELKSPKKGRVKKMLAREGAAVNSGDALAVIE